MGFQRRLRRPIRFSRLASLIGLSRLMRCGGFDGKARRERIERGSRLDLGGVEVELAAPDQPSLLALRDNRLEEAAKRVQAIAGADARQTRMVGQRLVQVVAQ